MALIDFEFERPLPGIHNHHLYIVLNPRAVLRALKAHPVGFNEEDKTWCYRRGITTRYHGLGRVHRPVPRPQ